jgi:hypothetical protein
MFVRPHWVERQLLQLKASSGASQLDVFQDFGGHESPTGSDDSTIIPSTTLCSVDSFSTSADSSCSNLGQASTTFGRASTTFETPVTSQSIKSLAVQVTTLHEMVTKLASDIHNLVAPSTSPESTKVSDTSVVPLHDTTTEPRAGLTPCLSVQSPDSFHLSHSITSSPSCHGKVAWQRARKFAATRKRALDAITSVTDC